MKKMNKILLILVVVFLTGCSSYDMSMKIDKKKRMDLVLTILSDTDTIDINEYSEKFKNSGYHVEKYEKDEKSGIVISKHFDNIDDISFGKREDEFDLLYFYSNDYSEDVEKKMFNVDKNLDTNRYAANFYVDLSDLNIDLENTIIKFNVSLPNSNFSNNANFVSEDGNELTWNITSLGKTDIDFVFELRSYDYVYYAVAILIIIFLVFSIWGNLMGTNTNNKTTKKQYKKKNAIPKKTKNIKESERNSFVQENVEHKNRFMPEMDDVKPVNKSNGLLEQFDSTFIKENKEKSSSLDFNNGMQNSSVNQLFNIPLVPEINNTSDENSVVENQNISSNSGNDDLITETQEDNMDEQIYDNFTEEVIKVNSKDVVVNKKKNENRF